VTTITTSAPAKVILLGEHGVNRGQPALATALEVRVRCRVAARSDDRYALRSDGRSEAGDYGDLRVYKAEVD
jgi:mevalonate kinase